MSCNCKKDLEAKLLDRFKQQSPDAKDHDASIKGYSIVFGEKTSRYVGAAPAELTASHPLKKGGFKSRCDKISMIFTYCPFCGKKYEEVVA